MADKRRINLGLQRIGPRDLEAKTASELHVLVVVPAGFEPATFRV
jgi:hypothetical protein